MTEAIALLIFLIGLVGIIAMIYRKIPVLAEYDLESAKREGLFAGIREKIKDKVAFRAISSGETILLKLLSKTRVVALKAENQIGHWLSALRQKSIEKEENFRENYWEKIKAKKKGKKKSKPDNNLPV